MAGIIGVKHPGVGSALKAYATNFQNEFPDQPSLIGKGLTLCLGTNGVTAVFGETFSKSDHASEFLSKYLKAPVFSFHMYDDDFWMYLLYREGKLISKFHPKPRYFDENEDVEPWRGDAQIVAEVVPGVTVASIEKYFVFCTQENGQEKAYPSDQYPRWDFWQIIDFMDKLGLAYPFSDEDDDSSDGFESVTL